MLKFALIITLAGFCFANKPDVVVQFDPSTFTTQESYIQAAIDKVWNSNAPQICQSLNIDCSNLNEIKRDFVLENVLYNNMHVTLQYTDKHTNIFNGVIIKCTYPVDVSKESKEERLQYVRALKTVVYRKLRYYMECSIEDGQDKPIVSVDFAAYNNDIDQFIQDSLAKVWTEHAPAIATDIGANFADVDSGTICPILASTLYNGITITFHYDNTSSVPIGADIACKYHYPANWTTQDKLNYMKTLQYVLGNMFDINIRNYFVMGRCKDPVTVIFPDNSGSLSKEKFAQQAADIAWKSNVDFLAESLGVQVRNINYNKIDDTLAAELSAAITIEYFYNDGEWNIPNGMVIICCFHKPLTTNKDKLEYLSTLKYVIERRVTSEIIRSITLVRHQEPYTTLFPPSTSDNISNNFLAYLNDAINVTIQTHLARLEHEYNITLAELDAVDIDLVLANKVVKTAKIILFYAGHDHQVPVGYHIDCQYVFVPPKMTQDQRNIKLKTSIYVISRLLASALLNSLQGVKVKPDVVVMLPIKKSPIQGNNQITNFIKKTQQIVWNSNLDLVSYLYNVNAADANENAPSATYQSDLEKDVKIKLTFEDLNNNNPSGVIITCNSQVDVTSLSPTERNAFVNTVKRVIFDELAQNIQATLTIGRRKDDICVLLPQWTTEELKQNSQLIKNIIWESNKDYLAEVSQVTVAEIEAAGPVSQAVTQEIQNNVNVIYENTPLNPITFEIICNLRIIPSLTKTQRSANLKASRGVVFQKIDDIINGL